MFLNRSLIILLLIGVFIYTISYGNWNFKQKNRLGAIMIYFVALIALVLPIYVMFFRD